MARLFVLIAILLTLHEKTFSQDTLPRFTVVIKAPGTNLISWTNPFPFTSQISIQRSQDSLRNFVTILTVPDPTVPQNGFVDAKAGVSNVFYRLFIVLDSGKYQFSRSRRPAPDTAVSANGSLFQDNQRVVLADSLNAREVNTIKAKLKTATPAAPAVRTEKFFIVRKKNLTIPVSQKNFKKFRDSIVYETRDTMVFASVDTVIIKPFVPAEIYRASKYVFTEKFGNVMVSLPDAAKKKYSLSFFEENKTPLFQIDEVQSTSLVIDKTNFIHSGWFWFELYENGTLKERHRFFIPRDF